MLLSPTVIHTDIHNITFHDGVLVAEASMLPAPSQVWDDACDAGYTVRSARTGTTVLYLEGEATRDREGELQYVTYAPHDKRGAMLTTLPLLRVYND